MAYTKMDKLTPKLFKEQLSKLLLQQGFVLKSSTWHKELNEAIIGVNIQRSTYSALHFVNYFVWYPAITERVYQGYIKGCFHLTSRGPGSSNRQRESLLVLDGRMVDINTFMQKFEEVFSFSNQVKLLHRYSLLSNVGYFLKHHYDENTGFATESTLQSYLKSSA